MDPTENTNDTEHGGEGGYAPGDHAHAHGQRHELYGILAEFHTPTQLVAAAEKVKNAGFTEEEWDCYSPFPIHGIDEAMGIKRTILPVIVFLGGCGGLFLGLLLQWYSNAFAWEWTVSGKPIWSIAANIPIGFETTILLAVFSAFFGMWALNKLPAWWHPWFAKDRFLRATDDRFFVGIRASSKRFDMRGTTALLNGAGAAAIESVYIDGSDEARRLPRPLIGFIIASSVLALIPFALIFKAQAAKSEQPHYHIFPDMDFQPKVKSDSRFDLFADDRGNRGEIPGTIARGSLHEDTAFYQGIDKDAWIATLPAQITGDPAAMERGKNRYEIYCTPCHGFDGKGKGAVALRALRVPTQSWTPPADLTTAVNVQMPNGQLFNTISNGKGGMLGYAAQIPVEDRWKIVLYVRALQLAANASIDDVPQDMRTQLR